VGCLFLSLLIQSLADEAGRVFGIDFEEGKARFDGGGVMAAG
jgi:hypothetical protein